MVVIRKNYRWLVKWWNSELWNNLALILMRFLLDPRLICFKHGSSEGKFLNGIGPTIKPPFDRRWKQEESRGEDVFKFLSAKGNTVWCGMVRYGAVWYGMVRYGVVWCGMVWYGRVRYGTVHFGGAQNGYTKCTTNSFPPPSLGNPINQKVTENWPNSIEGEYRNS